MSEIENASEEEQPAIDDALDAGLTLCMDANEIMQLIDDRVQEVHNVVPEKKILSRTEVLEEERLEREIENLKLEKDVKNAKLQSLKKKEVSKKQVKTPNLDLPKFAGDIL